METEPGLRPWFLLFPLVAAFFEMVNIYHYMKFIITKEEIDLIPPVVRRRMTERDFDILDDVIHNNKRYYVAQDFNRYLEGYVLGFKTNFNKKI